MTEAYFFLRKKAKHIMLRFVSAKKILQKYYNFMVWPKSSLQLTKKRVK